MYLSMKAKEEMIWKRAIWFKRKMRFDIDYFDLLQPRREVSHGRRYRSGLFHSEKCGRDIQYESSLELGFVRLLEENQHVVFYWDQPIKIPYWRGRRKVTYTPDYGIYLDTGYFVLAEVKDLPGMLDFRVQQKTEALMAFCSDRGFGLLLTDGRHTPVDLLKGKVNRRLERALLAALDEHPLRQAECREIMQRCNATPSELYRAIVRLRLKFRPFPMKLQLGNENDLFRQVFFERKKYEDSTGFNPDNLPPIGRRFPG